MTGKGHLHSGEGVLALFVADFGQEPFRAG